MCIILKKIYIGVLHLSVQDLLASNKYTLIKKKKEWLEIKQLNKIT